MSTSPAARPVRPVETRLRSRARNRALATLKRRHRGEWEAIRASEVFTGGGKDAVRWRTNRTLSARYPTEFLVLYHAHLIEVRREG